MTPTDRDDITISTDRSRIDYEVIHGFLKTSYWAAKRPMETIRRSVEHSLPFGVYAGGRMIGFARVITDFGTFAYVADVFILEEFRGRGLSKRLMQAMLDHSELQGMRRWLLATLDAHGLYSQFGFKPLEEPFRWMERRDPAQ